MKKKLLMLCLLAFAFGSMLFLTSCDKIIAFIDNPIHIEEGEPPTIAGLETIKAYDGYLESDEYLYNSQGSNPMALSFSEDYYLVIRYNNDSKKTISSVSVSWKDSSKPQPSSQVFKRDSFGKGSNETVTYIPFSTGDSSELKSGEIVFTVTSVLYTSGTSTLKAKYAENVKNNITVAIRPASTLTLDYMNADKRRGFGTQSRTATYNDVYYKTEMRNYITAADYKGETTVPVKEGGWVFNGWYTEPLGQGRLIKDDDTFDFWGDMTLYANYERIYDIDLEPVEEAIEHTYRENGSERKITFKTGAVLKNKGRNESTSVRSNYFLDIPDTIVLETYDIVQETRSSDGMPQFEVRVSATEYPVIKIAPNAFSDYTTIITAKVGKYVREIGYRSFSGCTKMENLIFSDGSALQYIGDYAFEDTRQLGRTSPFTLPSTVEYLGMCAFRYSGWGITRNDGSSAAGETRLVIPATWKYIGYKCFFNTRFERVVFRPDCYFESQISDAEGSADESAQGSKTIRYGQNRIGASIFGMCYPLWSVVFESDSQKDNGLNIIPELCFDAGSWYNKSDDNNGTFRCISYVSFAEGLKYIGGSAFNYQVKIPELCLPKTLEEVGARAFYNCESVTNLNFEHVTRETIDKEGVNKALTKDSQLRIIRHCAFSNLRNIDVVYITSEHFALYGYGVFEGCSRLKCIFFNNILDEDHLPTGFKSSQAGIDTEAGAKYTVAKGYSAEEIDDDEVMDRFHEMSDFLYGTAESGDKESGTDEFSMTYSSPVRVFCSTEYCNTLKEDMLIGKNVYANVKTLKFSSGTKSYDSQVFVHSLDDLHEYKYTVNGEEKVVSIAVQEIHRAIGGQPSTTVLGYSLVYWGSRSENIVLPTHTDLNLRYEIKEIAAYAIPTSVRSIYIPSTYNRLEHDAFNGCSLLSNVEFEDVNTLTYVGQYAFFGTAIRSFVGGTALKVIAPYAFNRCESLVWVDLKNTLIKNTYNGRIGPYYQYKYEYELDDYDDDFVDCLGNSAFQACPSLKWVYLPENIQQIRSSTFINCHSLTTIIIPTTSPSQNMNANDDDCFYEYAQPSTIFDPGYLHQIHFYVASSATDIHQRLLDPQFIADGRYNLIDAAPSHP